MEGINPQRMAMIANTSAPAKQLATMQRGYLQKTPRGTAKLAEIAAKVWRICFKSSESFGL
ncbi:hypothetical protein CLAFUW4_07622 [Fulvia fulva]|uniref:Uncharacterized protein n=1 Tax=Passalora fulva TaxID=5499 RepID=A0A9Q8UQF4_PASFU|nr:uncharacterized protein CLAFUR5_07752 [Fulvia fulva]KAK4609037.1 hypothetical protein CLAFUR4_14789 [Fulvia fulva]KAK4621658.1 hypothetical protein CLAFUR4_07627 [Fulvia fulva]KAK4622928.1 hypothetical protein CLAFUR0_07627 [Fulvia fulva]UJO18656.1 hypothetical protein CLAFUR5_07752 [Fulvia fulva]WPV16675.1 hypothetical protein CLAFUW4_07622 [Fulvia fulva]